jgi:hypothetical protein
MAPGAAQRASFQKNRLADSGAVVDGEAADIEDQALQNLDLRISILECRILIYELRSGEYLKNGKHPNIGRNGLGKSANPAGKEAFAVVVVEGGNDAVFHVAND